MEKTYILLAHGIIADGDITDMNIHSVVKSGQKLLTKLYKPFGNHVLPLLSDICKNGLNNKLTTNVKVSACKDTIRYAGLYECRQYPNVIHPTRIYSFNACQSFTLDQLYVWLMRRDENKHKQVKLIFVGCIGPTQPYLTTQECIDAGVCIDYRYNSQVQEIKARDVYDTTNLDKRKRYTYEDRLLDDYPFLDLINTSKFPDDFHIMDECNTDCETDCVAEDDTEPYDPPPENSENNQPNEGSEKKKPRSRTGGSRRKSKTKSKRKKKKKLSKYSRKKKHTRRLNRWV